MKNVIVIRHTKSDWSNARSDFDRPVREDRKEDACIIAKEILKKGALPQYVIASPAMRTLQTAKLICAVWHYPLGKIVSNKTLYECTAQDIFTLIKKMDDKFDTIAIICHNPAITAFVNIYSDRYLANMPTTGAAYISFDVPYWKDIKDKGISSWILRPKELK
jgi:phosphohistidine phosphatase